jgi:hypothetical protein
MKQDLPDRKRGLRHSARALRVARTQVVPDEPRHQLLGLQRQVGNAAVARLIQRAPKDRPASTDAPWASKKPKAPTKKPEDIHARVIKAEIDGGKTLITIGSGPDQGVRVGMSGALVSEKGKELQDFTIETADGRISKAYIDTILDEVRRNPNVVIKASSFVSMEGKEF